MARLRWHAQGSCFGEAVHGDAFDALMRVLARRRWAEIKDGVPVPCAYRTNKTLAASFTVGARSGVLPRRASRRAIWRGDASPTRVEESDSVATPR